MNPTNHPYTAEDLMRYARGEMTPAEQHALEMAALDDPFLSDALEGYLAHTPDEETMLTLRTSVKSLHPNSNQATGKIWIMRSLSVAAALAVLCFAGYVALRSENADQDNAPKIQLAENTKTDRSIETDSLSQVNLPKTTKEIKSTQPIKTTEKISGNQNQLIESKPDEAVAFSAPIMVEDLRESPKETSIQEADLTIQSQTTAADATKFINNSIAAKDEENKKAESVQVTTASIATKKSRVLSTTSVSAKQVQEYGEHTDEQQFQAYLAKQPNRICAGTNGDAWHGVIVLSFTVNRKSRPTEIRVESASDAACVEASKDILDRGPDWDKSIKGRRTVRISW